MRSVFRRLSCLFVAMVLAAAWPAASATADEPPRDRGTYATTPTLHGAAKWRIGYLEGGQYPDYEVILKATLRGLMELGWIEPMTLPPENNPEPGGFWRWLSANVRSAYLEFPEDAYYAPGNFDGDKRAATREAVIERLNTHGDIDLMIAMGTWAGQDLANDQINVPTVVASTSNPIASKIVKSATDSGFDHLHAKVEPDRYARQVEIFHDIIGFQRLGIVYEDTPEGRTFGGVDEVEKVAGERGFEIVRCLAPFSGVTQEEAEKRVAACYAEIAPKVDAVYITVHRGVTIGNLPNIMEPINRLKVPSFSMLGAQEVQHGVLMSISQAGYSYVGQFHAETIAKIFNGAKPRDLEQRWVAPSKIALNLKTAELIGYDPPVDILIASDELFEEIAKPEPKKKKR
ncbi:ABC transporter substrate-binding protein [Azospirillum sp. ST 5-10]|uniref:ABC transporter substrate-binding protein n=1 Tax=unclassified Azospirillum TaxID=2630922 RepID=UPI003F4A67CB